MGDEKSDERALVTCSTTKGTLVMEYHRHWSPHGYDRAVGLFEKGFYDHSHFFRTIPEFLVQFGITYKDGMKFQKPIPDDPQLDPPIPFEIGTIAYAGSGPNSRDAQMFIALHPGEPFGLELWETPVGRVVEGLDEVVKQFHSYGDDRVLPNQQQIYSGPQYIEENFPLTDSFKECKVERLKPNEVKQKEPQEEHLNMRQHNQQQQQQPLKPEENVEREVMAATSENEMAGDSSTSGTAIDPTLLMFGGGALLIVFLMVAVKIFAPRKKSDKRN